MIEEQKLPDLWQIVQLGDVTEIIGGSTPSRLRDEYFGGEIAWATPTDVTSSEELWLIHTAESITEEGLNNSSAKLLPAGAVLMTSRATIGETAIAAQPMATNQGFANFVCDDAVLFNEYLAYYLPAIKERLLQLAGGTTFKEISKTTLVKLRIPLPPLPEQQRIVEVLRRTDALRQLRRQANQRAEELLSALFYETFGDHTVRRKVWDVVPISDVGDVRYGLTVNSRRRSSQEQHSYLRVANVQRWQLDLSELAEIGTFPGDLDKFALQKGDILVVEGHADPNELGRAAVWNEEIPLCLHQNHLLRIRPNPDKVTPNYLAGCINSARGQQYMLRFGKTSSGLNTINSTVLSDMSIALAPLEMQHQFEQQYFAYQKLKEQCEQATSALNRLFNSFLTQAFTGELTAAWREANADSLSAAAAERDRLLGLRRGAPRPSPRLDLSTETGQQTLADDAIQAAVHSEFHSVDNPRYPLLKELSVEQMAVYLAARQQSGYFRAQELTDAEDLPAPVVERGLAVLAETGLIRKVRVDVSPDGRTSYLQSVYRNLDESRDASPGDMDELNDLLEPRGA